MALGYIIAAAAAMLLTALIGVFYIIFRFMARTNRRIDEIDKSIKNLADISKYFPDFIQKGERVTKNMSEELALKQNVLTKLIAEANKASEKLGMAEEKIKDNKLDKDMIGKILILVNQGFTPQEIAPKLNIPLGEIELVIKLRKYISSPIREKL
ncbi:MAG: DUF6115 domain-containing protein [Candidatus Omnitrophota bacterium]